jgi:ribonuclease E
MGKQIMLVNVHEDETRIALVEEDILVGLHVQQTDRERKVGNIYRGRVVKINPAFQAAFVDYGEPRNGFLSISDVNFNLHRPREGEKGRPKIQNVLREGQPVMVQILKEGMSNKGSALTTFISLAGRYMVMSPNSDRSGVSRKIEDPDTRRRLKDVMEALTGGEELGVIIRTAGIDQPAAELKKDLETLRKEWKAIQTKHEKTRKAGLLYQEPSPIVRVLRDYFSDSVQEVWVDDAQGFQEALGYFKSTLPKYQKRLKLYVGDKSLFSAHRIEEQIEALDSAKVPLKSGGSIIIESTEAMVSVDVNSGRSNQSQDIEDTALRSNSEAAEEIARQLRLRNLGGLIVIDFIDMMQAKNRKAVEKRLADALKDDKARTTLGSISQFGLLELSRQRIDMELSRGLRVQCPSCGGTGRIPTVNSSANNVLRKIRELAATGQYREVHGEMPLDAANFLLNDKREALRDLELEFEIALKLEVDPDLPPGHPISLHGSRLGEAEGEPEHREEGREEGREDRSETAAQSAADEGRRRRRRRRRHRHEEMGGGAPSAEGYAEPPDNGRMDEGELPPLAAHDRFDEELEVEEMEEADRDTLAQMAASPDFEPPPPAPRPERGGRERGGRERGGRERGGRERRPRRDDGAPPQARGNGQPGALMFKSEHIITDPEAVEKMPPARVRSNPFRELSGAMPPNSVVFDSAGLLPIGQPVTPAPEAPPVSAPDNGVEKDEDEGSAGPRRRRRGRRGGARHAAPEAGEQTPQDDPDGDDPTEGESGLYGSGPEEPEPAEPAHDDYEFEPDEAALEEAEPDEFAPDEPPAAEAAQPAPAGDGPARRRPRRGRGRGRGGDRPAERAARGKETGAFVNADPLEPLSTGPGDDEIDIDDPAESFGNLKEPPPKAAGSAAAAARRGRPRKGRGRGRSGRTPGVHVAPPVG